MPNWCEQDLNVTCKKEHNKEMKEFIKFFKDAKTEDIIPLDKSKAREKFDTLSDAEKGRWMIGGERTLEEAFNAYWFNNGGYEQCCEAWGSKWGISHKDEEYTNIDEEYGAEAKFSWESAWSPTIPVVQKLSEMYPNLTFVLTYFERGCAFNGRVEFKGGEELSHEEGAYFGDRGG